MGTAWLNCPQRFYARLFHPISVGNDFQDFEAVLLSIGSFVCVKPVKIFGLNVTADQLVIEFVKPKFMVAFVESTIIQKFCVYNDATKSNILVAKETIQPGSVSRQFGLRDFCPLELSRHVENPPHIG